MLHSVRFLAIDPKRFESLLAPWLCKKYPGALSIFIKHVVEPVTTLDRAILNPSQSVSDLRETISVREFSFNCD